MPLTPTPLATLTLDDTTKIDPAQVLQICHVDVDLQTPPPLPCEDVIQVAVQALGADAARLMRAELGAECPGSGCPSASPERSTVVFSGLGWASEVTVIRTPGGELAPIAIRTVPTPVAAPFTAPAVARPVITGAPKSISQRMPFSLCGDETVKMGGPYDEAGRRCFLAGVLAGARVEFVSRSWGIEGEPTVEIYRFAGTGGILIYAADNGRWGSWRSGIAEAGGGLVFGAAGLETVRIEVR